MDLIPVTTRQTALKALTRAWKAELHDIGASYALSNQTSAATITCLNTIVQGDLQGNRDGARVSLERIAVNYCLAGPVAPTAPLATGTRVRVALLWDTQTNGVAPTEAMIQETTTDIGAMAIMPNFNYRDRLHVLYDRLHVLSSVSDPKICVNFSISLTGKQTNYVAGAGAGTVADVITGGLFWYVKPEGADNITSNSLCSAIYFHP